VKVIGVFPDNTDDPIIYPVALTANAKSDAVQYLSFLRTQTAKSIFVKYGLQFPRKADLLNRFCPGALQPTQHHDLPAESTPPRPIRARATERRLRHNRKWSFRRPSFQRR
jgi:hypothetical protein